MSNHEVRTRTSVTRLDVHGIIRTTILPGVEQTLADAQENARDVLSLATRSNQPLLVDLRDMKAQSREARQYYGSPEITNAFVAVGLLVGSRVSMLIANFFIAVTKTNMPTRIFTDEAEAIDWLKGLIK
jgi:hypothetical protein